MKIINYPKLDEKVIYEKLDNGLEIYLIPKKDYEVTTAVFTTKFGSVNHGYEVDDEIDKVLPGAAHFLEHRLFDYRGKDMLQELTKYGASVNAYTALNRTSYYFTTSKNLKKNLNLLLDFVQEFDVSLDSIEREKKIIIQELLMNYDEPSNILYREIKKSLYQNHPYKGDIIGDIESINKTTFSHLKACHNKFYHPSNMFLVIAGKMDYNLVLNYIKENQSKKSFTPIEGIKRFDFKEPKEVVREYYEVENKRTYNLVSVVVKMEPLDEYIGSERSKIEKILEIQLEMLFGSASEFNKRMIEEKVYNSHGGYAYSNFDQMSYIEIKNTNVYDIHKFINEVKKILLNPREYINDEEFFEDLKRGMLSSFISEFNSISNLALEVSTLIADNNNFFDQMEDIKSITYQDVVNYLDLITKGKIAVCVVKGK